MIIVMETFMEYTAITAQPILSQPPAQLEPTRHRWFASLENYQFEIINRPGPAIWMGMLCPACQNND